MDLVIVIALASVVVNTITMLAVIAAMVILRAIHGETKVHTKQGAKLNWLLMRGNRARQSTIKTVVSSESPPKQYRLTDRRRDG